MTFGGLNADARILAHMARVNNIYIIYIYMIFLKIIYIYFFKKKGRMPILFHKLRRYRPGRFHSKIFGPNPAKIHTKRRGKILFIKKYFF